MVPKFILYNNSDTLLYVHLDSRFYEDVYEILEPNETLTLTGWLGGQLKIQRISKMYDYGELGNSYDSYGMSWRGSWIFAYNYINVQFEPEGDLRVLRNDIQPPISSEDDVYLVINPEKIENDV